MPRLSINELTTFRWTFEEDLRQYQAAGITAIGVWRRKIADVGEDRAVELLAASGLAVSNMVWIGGFTGSDGVPYRDALDDAREAIELAARMKCPTIVVYSGGRAGHTVNHARRLFQNALAELLPLAEERGIKLALEMVHPNYTAEWSILTQVDELLQLREKLDSPALGLALDTYHTGLQPEVLSRLAELVPHLAIVHLGDGREAPEHEQTRTRLGDGLVPLAEIFQELRRLGYDGDYDVELLGPEIEKNNYLELLQHCKAVFERLTTIS
jgi:sugar phosphate isomerase/epimerase